MLVCIVVSTLPLSHATAQPSDEQIGELSTFFTLFPELRTLPTPQFLERGLRVSYSTASGGDGLGAAGVLQYDVVALDPTMVLLYQHTYGDVGAGVIPLSQTVARGAHGLGPFWINPVALVDAERFNSASLTVSRFDKEVAGTTRTVVRFQTATGMNSRTVHEFSAASGLLVFSSVGTVESGAQIVLQSTRPLSFPWVPDAAPNWARPGATLDYEGSKTTTIVGGGTIQQPLRATIAVAEATRTWSTFGQTVSLDGAVVGTQQTVSGIAQLNGSLWLPRAALAAPLPSTPTSIDVDPISGAQTFIVAENETIVLQQELSGSLNRWTFNGQSGVLEQHLLQTVGTSASEETVLTRVGGSDLDVLAELPELPEQLPRDGNGDPDPDDPDDPRDPDDRRDPDDDDDVVAVDDPGHQGDSSGGCSSVGPPLGAHGSSPLLLLLIALAGRKMRR